MRPLRLAVLLALAAVTVVTTTAASSTPPPSRQVLFVGNVWDGTVTLIDAQTLHVIRTLDVTPDGKRPHDPVQAIAYPLLVARGGVNYVQGLAVSPDGRTLYVSRGYLGDVAAFDIGTGALLWRLEVDGLRADHIALSPDGRRLFVSAITANKVEAIDTGAHKVIGSFATGTWPHVIEFSADGSRVFVGSLGNQLLPSGLDGAKELTVADPRTLSVQRRYTFTRGVRPFAFSPDGATAYVQLSYLSGFVVLDLASGRVVRTVDLPVTGPGAHMKPSQYPNQAAHHGIDLSLDGSTICDAGTISDYAALIDRATLRTLAIIPTGAQPAEAVTSLDGRYCFVADRGTSNSVSVISYAQRSEVARIPVGQHPQEEAVARVPVSALGAVR